MTLRICSYNIEWFNHLFNKDNSLKTGNKEQARFTALQNVLQGLQSDLIGILEAPNTSANGTESTVTKLENFAAQHGLPTSKALTGYISGGTQEIAVLYNPNKLQVSHAPGGNPGSKSNPPFNGEFYFDTDEDRIKEVYKHYRPPLEVEVVVTQSGNTMKMIVAHPKSKGIFNSMDMLHWERESKRSRLKLYAECDWIRRRVDEWLDDDTDVIAMGDFNDGPGMDYYEFRYGHSAVEIIMGDIFSPERVLRSLSGKPTWTSRGWKPASARFKDRMTGDNVNVLIDHILVSAGVPVVAGPAYRIWNPYEVVDAEPLKQDLLTASDHFPVTLDLDV
ncbi:MAG: endonuclease/exonuclease/phosphatase family protein [Proteobacteria bacterium]|jgi:hypothetical protein|nr:endonuclease/exonuclease/phosphatase family protein [Pseudomonadota bacterium]MCG6936254.1 endonuclease/exonuclease/phosphatase family protein [Pseudomonadota bacterium]